MQLVYRGNDVPFAELFAFLEVPVFCKHLTKRNCELLVNWGSHQRQDDSIDSSLNLQLRPESFIELPKWLNPYFWSCDHQKITELFWGSIVAERDDRVWQVRRHREPPESHWRREYTLVWRFQAQLHVATISVANGFAANEEGVLSLAMYDS